MTRRVAITGIGVVTPVGNTPEALWEGVERGKSAVRQISRFDPTPFSCHVAAEVEFDPLAYMDAKKAHRLDRFSQIALATAKMALADSGMTSNEAQKAGMGIYTGSALGGVAFGEEQHEVFVKRGARAVSPMLALAVFGGASSSNIAIELGLTGPMIANANSCASAVIAIGEAARLIADGRATTMLAGGAEAPLAPLTFGAFALIKVLTSRNSDPETASRPFDAGRDGFVMAEGGSMLMLEDEEHAKARGAHIYAYVSGYATTNDAYHMTAPRPDGQEAARAISLALAEAKVAPEAIGYVNAHGSSTVLNDPVECRAIRIALGPQAERIAVSGTKGLHAHALGATGAIELAICSLGLQRGRLPGTINLAKPDPDCDLDLIGPEGRKADVEYVVKNSFGFGGINASLVLQNAA